MRTNEEIMNLVTNLRKQKSMTSAELAELVGVAKSAMSRYENRTRQFPVNKVAEFAQALGTTPEYLLGFQGQSSSTLSQITDTSAKLEEPRQKKVLCYAEFLLKEQENSKITSLSEYKVSSVAEALEKQNQKDTPDIENDIELSNHHGSAAGSGYVNDESDFSTAVLKASEVPSGADEIVTLHGDSMKGVFNDRDEIFIRHQNWLDYNGQMMLVNLGYDGVTCKYVYSEGNKIRLVSENDAYEDMIYSADEVFLIGKVL